MHWKICTIGKPSLAFAKSGVDEYLKRLKRYAQVDWQTFREAGQKTNSQQLLKASEGTLRIALDERGKPISTHKWVERIDSWELESVENGQPPRRRR